MYKIWQGRQLFHQTFWMQCKYSLESLNFAAFTKPNKHKTDSKDSPTTWPNLFSNTFTTVGEFKRLLQSSFSNCFSRHDGTVLPVPVTSTSARSSSPLSPTRAFWTDKSSQNLSPAVNFKRGISLKRFRYLLAAFHFRTEIWNVCPFIQTIPTATPCTVRTAGECFEWMDDGSCLNGQRKSNEPIDRKSVV